VSFDILDGLNPPQREAAGTLGGPLLVLAGAGSGKTRLLTHRIAWLLEQGVRPWNVLAVTFTNKAAAEMRERVSRLVGPDARHLTVSTFHSFCVRVLRQHIDRIGWTLRFSIYDTDDQKRLLKTIMNELGVDRDRWKPAAIARRIDTAKNHMVWPESYAETYDGPVGDPTERIYPLYQARLKAQDAVDFNDLINLTVQLWSQHAGVLSRYRDKYKFLLVDEYQDTNHAQFLLVQLLAGQTDQANVMVVGDDDQSIYGFRGADVTNILDFSKQWPAAKVVRLEQNYRSTGHILEAANKVVRNNKGRMEKALWTDKGDGHKVQLIVGDDETDEAERVVHTIDRLVRTGIRYGDIAVIYRTNAASRAFEKALVRVRIPHILVGAARFYQRREIRDIVSYLRLLLNPGDDMAFERVVNTPRRGIGARTLDDIRALALHNGTPLLQAAGLKAQSPGRARKGLEAFLKVMDALWKAIETASPGELVALAARASGYVQMLENEDSDEARGRLANLEELTRAVAEETMDGEADADPASVEPDAPLGSEPGAQPEADPEADQQGALQRLQAFLDRATLSGQADELPGDDDRGRVTLLTAHLAKGLEFPVVFVAGMFQGGFPHFMSESEEDLEEERRLVYVAFTRAKERLYLTRARRRLSFNRRDEYGRPRFEETEPSRFLDEIPANVIEWGGAGGFRGGGRGDGDRAARLARLGFSQVSSRGSSHGSNAGARRGRSSVRSPPVAVAPPTGHHRTRSPESTDELKTGVRVLHGKFGVGTIIRRSGPPSNLKLVVDFDSAGRRTLFARFAGLELIES
jgi:DNA helicase II / ATP-dependent DNA helicase PcrA